jgi:hypothetical protein
LPKEVSDYSTISKDNIAYINPEKEKLFLKEYTILFQQGMALYFMIAFIMMKRLNHIYIYILPRTKLDHDLARFKTQRTTKVEQTESGRYEFVYRLKKDKYGNPIPLKNYAKMQAFH